MKKFDVCSYPTIVFNDGVRTELEQTWSGEMRWRRCDATRFVSSPNENGYVAIISGNRIWFKCTPSRSIYGASRPERHVVKGHEDLGLLLEAILMCGYTKL